MNTNTRYQKDYDNIHEWTRNRFINMEYEKTVAAYATGDSVTGVFKFALSQANTNFNSNTKQPLLIGVNSAVGVGIVSSAYYGVEVLAATSYALPLTILASIFIAYAKIYKDLKEYNETELVKNTWQTFFNLHKEELKPYICSLSQDFVKTKAVKLIVNHKVIWLDREAFGKFIDLHNGKYLDPGTKIELSKDSVIKANFEYQIKMRQLCYKLLSQDYMKIQEVLRTGETVYQRRQDLMDDALAICEDKVKKLEQKYPERHTNSAQQEAYAKKIKKLTQID